MENLQIFFENVYNTCHANKIFNDNELLLLLEFIYKDNANEHFQEENAQNYWRIVQNLFSKNHYPKEKVVKATNLAEFKNQLDDPAVANDHYFDGDTLETFKTDFLNYLDNFEHTQGSKFAFIARRMKSMFNQYCDMIERQKGQRIDYP